VSVAQVRFPRWLVFAVICAFASFVTPGCQSSGREAGHDSAAQQVAAAESAGHSPVDRATHSAAAPTAVPTSPAQRTHEGITLSGPPISTDSFMSHVVVLASDAYEGRATATRGGDLAAEYIAGQFAAIGLLPGGENGTYFQEFEVALGSELTDETRFTVTGVDATPVRGADFVPFAFSSNDAFDAEVVFVGYGCVNPEKEYNDYRDIDVTGKVVLMLRREPPGWGEGGQPSSKATFQTKVYEAKDRGAAAVLIVNQRTDGGGEDRLARFGGLGGGGAYGLPAFHVTRKLADTLLTTANLPSLDDVQTRLDERGDYSSAALGGIRIAGQAGIMTRKGTTRNVIGLLPARGADTGEYLVIGAHYDHLGIVRAGSRSPRGSRGADESQLEIHNGADDNASGTSGIIELAKAMSELPMLRRSVVFMGFSGEEMGLLGSKHYVDHPTVPIEKVAAMINLDMIGRLKDDVTRIPVYGAKTAPELDAIVSTVGKAEGFGDEGHAGSMSRSDHAPFDRKGIPNLFFFTGTHPDYHMPTDDVEKVNADGAVRILHMIYDIAVQIANAPARPTYAKITPPPRSERRDSPHDEPPAEARSERDAEQAPVMGSARMGVMPNYEESTQPGMLLDDVSEGGPAATAGLKGGDRITKIGTRTVNNVNDYMAALRDAKPGDTVDVIVKRGSEELTIPVKLGGRSGGS